MGSVMGIDTLTEYIVVGIGLLVLLGGLGLGLVRMIAKASADCPEDREMLEILDNLNRILVVEYEDAGQSGRDSFNRKMEDILEGREKIMEIKDEGTGRSFITKGDNNNTEDQMPVQAEDVIGLYKSRIAGAGNIAMFMQTTPGLIVCVIVPMILLIGWDVLRRKMYEKARQQDTEALLAELEALRAMKQEKEKQDQAESK